MSGSWRCCGQLVEQRPGGSQIGGVEAFGKPAKDSRERLARLVPLALPAEQPAEARRRAQLPRPGALTAGDLDRPTEGKGGPRLGVGIPRQQQLSLEPVQLRDPELRLRRLSLLQGGTDSVETRSDVAVLQLSVREKSENE